MKILRLCSLICICLMMNSCTTTENQTLSETALDTHTTSTFLVEETERKTSSKHLDIAFYSDEELNTIASFEGKSDELETLYLPTHSSIVNCTPSGQMSNIVGFRHLVYYGKNKVLVASYHFQDRTKASAEYYPVQFPKTYFDSISIGNTMEDVKKLDPEGEYIETEAYHSNYASYHYTADGFVINILYRQNKEILKISVERFVN